MIATGFFSDSLALDVTVVCTLLGGFATIIGMLVRMRKSRMEEIQSAVQAAIHASPEKVVISPQPMLVEMKREFVRKEDFQLAVRRIKDLEDKSSRDKEELMAQIADVPSRTITLLRETKGLL